MPLLLNSTSSEKLSHELTPFTGRSDYGPFIEEDIPGMYTEELCIIYTFWYIKHILNAEYIALLSPDIVVMGMALFHLQLEDCSQGQKYTRLKIKGVNMGALLMHNWTRATIR